MHGPGFSHARSLRPRTARAPLRHRRHLLDHRQRGQGARDVPHGAGDFAGLDDRGGRARVRHSGNRAHAGCRPHRQRRRHRVDARVPGRGPDCAGPPPAARFRLRPARHGGADPRQSGLLRHHHRLHGLPDGLQLLHHLGVLRRQGKDAEPLLHRRGTVPPDGGSGEDPRREIVLHHGRELPAAEETRDGTAGR